LHFATKGNEIMNRTLVTTLAWVACLATFFVVGCQRDGATSPKEPNADASDSVTVVAGPELTEEERAELLDAKDANQRQTLQFSRT
jgi:hypothetical protein